MPEEAQQPLGKAEANLLAARFQAGDAAAFDQLVLAFQRPVFNLAYRMLSSYDDASDVTQEIFVKVHRAIARFRGDAGFSTWLYTVAANTCRNHLRARARRTRVEIRGADKPGGEAEPAATDPAAGPDTAAERGDLVRHVERIVAQLPPDFAVVLIMKDMRDMPYEDIAESLGCSLGTVKSRLARARAMVKDRLAPLMT